MKHMLTALLLGAGLATPALAQDTTDLVVLHAWPHHAEWQTEIANRFMADHPDVKISFQAPSTDYDEGLVSVIRQNMAGDAPDVFMVGSHLLRNLVARGMVKPLDDVMEGQGHGGPRLHPRGSRPHPDRRRAIRPALDQFDAGHVLQQGSGRPGPAATPTTCRPPGTTRSRWRRRSTTLGPDIFGMYYTLGDDDWMTQNLLATDGLSPMSDDRTEITFATDEGRAATHLYARFFDEANQQAIQDKPARQQMFAGQMGLYFNSTAAVRSFEREIGDRFAWDTAPMPTMTEGGGVAAGGMAAVILTDDPAKRKAAFDYVLFGTNAESQAYIVEQTGYMPVNSGSLDVLKSFYAAHPAFETSAGQIDRAFPWFAWPGQNGVRISQIVLDDMTAIGTGQMTSDEAAAKMTDQIKPLME